MAKEKKPLIPHRCDICGSEQGVRTEYYFCVPAGEFSVNA